MTIRLAPGLEEWMKARAGDEAVWKGRHKEREIYNVVGGWY